MPGHDLIARAAEPTLAVVRGVAAVQVDNPTPCEEYSVRGLVNHLLFWGPTLIGAAHHESVPPAGVAEREVDLVGADWRTALTEQIEDLVEGWSDPDAWTGVTRMGSDHELSASLVGGMVAAELVVHGWDLARATDQRPTWDDDVVEFVRGEVAGTARQGRDIGVYGPEVIVPDDASPLDRLLGLTGRDPRWKAI